MKNKRLHFCFNLISDPNWHAGNIYIFNCIEALNTLPPEIKNTFRVSVAVRKGAEIPDKIKNITDQIYTDTLIHLVWYRVLRMLPPFCRLKWFNFRKIDFYYPGSNLPRKWMMKWAGWIPDFQYKYLPELFSEQERHDREQRNLHLASNAPVLAFSSRNAMEDYHRFFPSYKGNEYLLHFVSKADPETLKHDPLPVQEKFSLPERFYIVCNQFWKHKDHGTVIDAMGLLKAKGISINVVCTGSTADFRNPEYFPSLMEKARQSGVENNFLITGFLSRFDQIQLIRRSLAIIQPSLFEGWSTVVEDGRSLGKTIFLSDIPVHLEQAPPYTHYFKQQHSGHLAELIEKYDAQLNPGPDPVREQTALQQNHDQMMQFGMNLLQMAHTTVSKP